MTNTYKLFIVDDEILVKTQLKLLIPWEAEHLSLSGEASNGEIALSLIQNNPPDIIICDMDMPVMDGLQLCSILHEKYPRIQFIALSNYDDYQYVRGVLKLGAVDYLLKNDLTQDSITKVLKRAVEEIIDSTDQKNNALSRTPNNMEALRKDFFIGLLSGFYTDKKRIESQFKILSIDLPLTNLIPIVMEVDHYQSFSIINDLEKISVLEFSIQNICNELLTESFVGTICLISANTYALILSFDHLRSTKKRIDYITQIISHIKAALKKFLNISVSFSIGSSCSSVEELRESFKLANKSRKNKFYSTSDSLIIDASVTTHNEAITGLSSELEKKLVQNLTLGDSHLVISVLSEIFADINERKLIPNDAQMIFNDMVSMITRFCKSENLDYDTIYYNKIYPRYMIHQFETLKEIHHWFYHTFCNLVEQLNVAKEDTTSPYVKEAITLIKKNYSKNISQSELAQQIGISSNYLSSLFKSDLQIGFTEYLTNYRLSKAKMLIENGNKNFHEIVSECGFYNYNYFFKLFKKKVGMTPKEYANSLHMR